MKTPYVDIIRLPHHVSQNHPQMPMLDRAAQFAPFAALTGYEAAVGETARQTAERRELDPQEAAGKPAEGKKAFSKRLVLNRIRRLLTVKWYLSVIKSEKTAEKSKINFPKKKSSCLFYPHYSAIVYRLQNQSGGKDMKVKIGNGQDFFSVVLAGDICPGGFCEKPFTQDYAGVTASVKNFVESGDLRLVQWETPVTEHPAPIIKCGPNLNSEEASIETITAAGFNIAMLANNHTGDHGPAAALETIEKLRKHGLKTVGAGKDLISARTPLIENVKGKNIAVFNFAENEFGGAKAGKAGSAPQDPLRDVAEVRAAAAKYDIVIVTLHGGHEHDPFPSPRMVRYCRAFADAGARLVFNCHTHCPEGYENWNGTPIIYSPGNFYFPTNRNLSKLWWFGYLVRCSFGENGATELELLPYTFDKEKVKVLDTGGATKFEAYMKKLCAPLNDPARLQQYLEAWSTVHGKAHYNMLNVALPPGTDWLAELSDPVIMKRAMRVRNIFTCEAHNDLLKCWVRLVEEQRLDEAAQLYSDIEELQKGFMD